MESEGFVARTWSRLKRYVWIFWLLILFISNRTIEAVGEHIVVIRRELELFVGTALILAGTLGFNAGRMCDGNTSDYLSCTRPSAYHFYSGFDILLVILGTFLIILWYLRRAEAKK